MLARQEWGGGECSRRLLWRRGLRTVGFGVTFHSYRHRGGELERVTCILKEGIGSKAGLGFVTEDGKKAK